MNANTPPDLVEPGSEDDLFAVPPRLAQLLRHYRQRAGLSQIDLSNETARDDAGNLYPTWIDQSSISDIERGEVKKPRDATLDRLAEALARHLPGSSADRLALRLKDAARRRPHEFNVLPALVEVDDRLSERPPAYVRAALRMINAILDGLEEVADGEESP